MRKLKLAILLVAAISMQFERTRAVADIKSKAAREAADYILKKFGSEALHDGAEGIARKLESLAAKHGDEVFNAAKAAGPRGIRVIEELGDEPMPAVRLLSRYGEDAIELVRQPKALHLATEFGDEAAEALIRHPGAAESVIEAFGKPAASALKGLDGQNARRLAMMVDDGSLAKIPQHQDLLAIIGRYGDRAMEFVWKHRGVFVAGTVASAFWKNPKPFIDGGEDLVKTAIDELGKPIVIEATRQFPWTVFYFLASLFCLIAAAPVIKLPIKRAVRLFARTSAIPGVPPRPTPTQNEIAE
jgi:hypothetical protein